VEEAMSAGPPGWAPLPAPPQVPGPQYYAPSNAFVPPPPQKPSSFFKAIGIIQIVLGMMGIFYSLFSIATTAYSSSVSRFYTGPVLALLLVHAGVSVITGAMLVATGFGVVRAKRWSRIAGVAYAVTSMLNTLGGTVVQLAVVQPTVMRGVSGLGSAGAAVSAVMVVSTLLGVLVALVVPVGTLIILLRPAAKAELDQ
jgi:hypothetical protein